MVAHSHDLRHQAGDRRIPEARGIGEALSPWCGAAAGDKQWPCGDSEPEDTQNALHVHLCLHGQCQEPHPFCQHQLCGDPAGQQRVGNPKVLVVATLPTCEGSWPEVTSGRSRTAGTLQAAHKLGSVLPVPPRYI